MKNVATQLSIGILAPVVGAQLLIGYGNHPYNPLCSESCLRSFSSLGLDCTAMDMDHSGLRRRHDMMPTTPECFAESTPFLTSVAWCMSTRCAEQGGVPDSLIQSYWEYWVTSSQGKVPPKWSYAEALAQVDPQPPAYQLLPTDDMLNVTSLVAPSVYLAQWNVLGAVNWESELESRYGYANLGAGILLPCR